MSLRPARPREDRTAASTREPGDLPRQHNVLGRGVPVVRLRFRARSCRPESSTRPLRPLPPTFGVKPCLSFDRSLHSLALPVASLGTPRIGPRRELKIALESYWSGKTDEKALVETARRTSAPPTGRARRRSASPSSRPTISRSTTRCSTPARWSAPFRKATAGTAARSARHLLRHGARRAGRRRMTQDCGHGHHARTAHGVPALEMTKWFDTNYHYMVPEFTKRIRRSRSPRASRSRVPRGQGARLSDPPGAGRPGDLPEARQEQGRDASIRCRCSPRLLPVYVEVLRELAAKRRRMGADRRAVPGARSRRRDAGRRCSDAYATIAKAVPELKIMLATYFGALGDNLDTALALPVAGLHVDLVRAPGQLDGVGKALRRISCCRSASSTAATSGAPI